MELSSVLYSSLPASAADPFQQHLIVVQATTDVQPDHTLLTADEIEKANRFVKENDRHSFLLRRATLRKLLSGWLQVPPGDIIYRQEEHGKPRLRQGSLHFNVSKTAGWNVYYFGPHRAGIDIECIYPQRRFVEIETTQLHPDEKKQVDSDLGFFAVWTRKEAVLKADGSGITDQLDRINTATEVAAYRGHLYRLQSFYGHDFVLSLALPSEVIAVPLLLHR